MNIGKYVASIVELFNREVKASGQKDIYKNDSDNLYPNRIELVERNSVTAFAASNKLKTFIVGQGFADESKNTYVVNKTKKITGRGFLDRLSGSLKTHRGAFIHVNYDFEGKVNYLDVLDFKKCRVAKEDSDGYPGKIYYKDWTDDKLFNRDKGRWFYPFNRNIEIIHDQMRADSKDSDDLAAALKSYRGQVYFLNLDDTEVYPFGWVNPVYNDADNEYRISLYRNNNLRTGFLGKTIIIPNGLSAENRPEFTNALKKWMGAENSGSVFVVSPDSNVEDPENVIKTIELKSNYDSKQFDNDEKSVANNIRKAYLSIPKILIDPEDSFFGSSGEAFKEAVKYYNSETLFLRDTISYLMEQFYPGEDWTIKELGDGVQS